MQLPKVFELVGLGYSAWFTYRYLLFKSSREELVEDIEALKKKIRCVGGWVCWGWGGGGGAIQQVEMHRRYTHAAPLLRPREVLQRA